MAVGEFGCDDLKPVKGCRIGATFADIKGRNPATITRDDVVLFAFDAGTTVAGVFTQNAFCAAPVTVCKERLGGEVRALVINAGNANACTGDQGLADSRATCEALAKIGGLSAEQVMPFSTGVIGEPMPMQRLTAALPKAWESLAEDNWWKAARGIMTTDTRPKATSKTIEYQGTSITLSGVSKGAGMIRPNMATMLAYIVTDAAIAQPVLQKILSEAADQSFNRITIDGDTSTNDSCILAATGASGAPMVEKAEGELYQLVRGAIFEVLEFLAKAIVADGEGATKFVTVNVSQGESTKECLRVAYSVAHSPLIKTALFASDPNWGRIVAAIGYAGVKGLDPAKINVYLGDVQIVADGCRAPSYKEQDGQRVMDQTFIDINIELGRGEAQERVWTTDFSHEYVTINAEYRT